VRIILVSGKSNSGKTTALGKLYDSLISFGACDITGNYDYDDEDCSEFDHVVEWKDKTIAIRFDGDVYQWCIDAIVRYAACDVLVLAYSDKFACSLVELVEKYASQCGHKVVRTKKVDTQEARENDNQRVCDEIIDLL